MRLVAYITFEWLPASKLAKFVSAVFYIKIKIKFLADYFAHISKKLILSDLRIFSAQA
jgi:hypothetical protein